MSTTRKSKNRDRREKKLSKRSRNNNFHSSPPTIHRNILQSQILTTTRTSGGSMREVGKAISRKYLNFSILESSGAASDKSMRFLMTYWAETEKANFTRNISKECKSWTGSILNISSGSLEMRGLGGMTDRSRDSLREDQECRKLTALTPESKEGIEGKSMRRKRLMLRKKKT